MAEITVSPIEVGRAEISGKPVVGNRHILVSKVALWHEHMGRELDEIATECGLTLGEVNAALACYHDHWAECDGPD